MTSREEAIQAVMSFDQPIEALYARFHGVDYDWAGEPLGVLTREHVVSVLRRWRRGELSDQDVEDWADLVELRDDLDHDPNDEAVAAAIFTLANPVLQGPLSEQGLRLLKSLQA